MNYDVIQAEYLEAYRLRVRFDDGASGEVDCFPFIEKGGVFEVLKDVERFKKFRVDPDWNTVTWLGGELDIAPETLYREATGSWPSRGAENSPEYGVDSGE